MTCMAIHHNKRLILTCHAPLLFLVAAGSALYSSHAHHAAYLRLSLETPPLPMEQAVRALSLPIPPPDGIAPPNVVLQPHPATLMAQPGQSTTGQATAAGTQHHQLGPDGSTAVNGVGAVLPAVHTGHHGATAAAAAKGAPSAPEGPDTGSSTLAGAPDTPWGVAPGAVVLAHPSQQQESGLTEEEGRSGGWASGVMGA
jgi:hypothetical protein